MPSNICQHEVILNSVIQWFEKAVLGLNLCPFAVKPHADGSIVFTVSTASDDESCLSDVFLNLTELDDHPEIETRIMICSQYLLSFEDYNQFLVLADDLLELEGWQGVYQIASFHPDYRFADTAQDDRENWSNRSPYPLLHFIREASIDKAVQHYPNIEQVPQRNVQTLKSLSEQQMREIFGVRYQK